MSQNITDKQNKVLEEAEDMNLSPEMAVNQDPRMSPILNNESAREGFDQQRQAAIEIGRREAARGAERHQELKRDSMRADQEKLGVLGRALAKLKG